MLRFSIPSCHLYAGALLKSVSFQWLACFGTLLDLCVQSLHRSHADLLRSEVWYANFLCIVPSLSQTYGICVVSKLQKKEKHWFFCGGGEKTLVFFRGGGGGKGKGRGLGPLSLAPQ